MQNLIRTNHYEEIVYPLLFPKPRRYSGCHPIDHEVGHKQEQEEQAPSLRHREKERYHQPPQTVNTDVIPQRQKRLAFTLCLLRRLEYEIKQPMQSKNHQYKPQTHLHFSFWYVDWNRTRLLQ